MQPNVLVVEDDADIRSALASLLRAEGYAVACAADGREALDRLYAGERPQVILLDLMMPVLSGAEFRVRQLSHPELARIPIVVLTADGRYREMAKALGAAAAFAKPFELDALLNVVAKLGGGGGTAALGA